MQEVRQKVTLLVKRLKDVAPVRLIVSSFFFIIVVGTILLALPISSRSGKSTHLIDALFISTSATCVTGLTLFDTWTHWNLFGQMVILTLIQIGGLGVVTFTTGFTLFLRRKLGLRDLQLARENTSGNTMDVAHLIRMIITFTFVCEGVGALLLMIRFVPQFGWRGVWLSVFEAISAYCNAGFDILGFRWPDQSLIPYAKDPLVSLVIAGLIIVGGLGFIVISDIYYAKIRTRLHREKPTHLNFHSVVVLLTTGILLLLGTILFFFCEYQNSMAGMHFLDRLNISFFQSASTRTAGFASINIAMEHDFTKIITILFMFIGASPGSTGGGIKTTTFVVLIGTVFSVMRGSEDTIIHKRKIEKGTVYRSLAIFILSLLMILISTGIILSVEKHPISGVDALFEATSAFGTVGLTAGITPILGPISKAVLCFTMFLGRVGPVSLALAIAMRRGRSATAVLPEGKIIVG